MSPSGKAMLGSRSPVGQVRDVLHPPASEDNSVEMDRPSSTAEDPAFSKVIKHL